MPETLVLASDIAFMPERDLRQHVQRAAGCEPGDWLLSMSRSRAASIVVSEELALLLREFRRPMTMGEAIQTHCALRGLDVPSVMARAKDPIRRMKMLGYLREPQAYIDSQELSRSKLPPTGAWRDPVLIQDLDGAQVFRVRWQRRVSVLKVGCLGSAHAETASVTRREAEILKQLPDGPFPKLLDAGAVKGRDFLLASWFEGSDALSIANHLRRLNPNDLLLICASILDSYRVLEAAGWLHRDVHPRNIIVQSGSDPRLIDFGQACRADEPRAGSRAGIAYFFDPQYAEALLNNTTPPPYDPASEQYALAALLHLLITGYHHQDFALERRQMLRQIVEGAPLQFSAHRNSFPRAVEAVLRRALRKAPEARFPTIAAFAKCFRSGLSELFSANASYVKGAEVSFGHGSVSQFAWEVPRPELKTLADAAVHDGAAGLAYAQYRLALLTQDPLLLASSEVWISRALSVVRTAAGRATGAVQKAFPGSLHHAAPGIYCVAALIARAQGNHHAAISSTKCFLQAVPDRASVRDITHGLAGSLVGCAILMENLSPECPEEILSALQHKGETLAQSVWAENESDPPGYVGEHGIAHGEAGRLYARLRWSQASHVAPSQAVTARVAAIFPEAQHCSTAQNANTPRGRARAASLNASWCNGGAGHILLLLLTAATTGKAQFAKRAAGIAEATWRDRARSACLCCGLSGRVFAMLSMARATGEAVWVERAAALVQKSEAAASALGSGLYKGRAGVELARIELAEPKCARMPLFE
jgi:eukaryotic-like serine/threonine-protein kinase